jgi:hypothetical protein
MCIVLSVAMCCAFWVWGRDYLARWEARRVVMYQQRDVTRSIILEAGDDIAAAGHTEWAIRDEHDRATYTTHWTEKLEAWQTRDGQKQPLIRATISGENGRFSLPPIIVETYGSPLDQRWLDRLLRTYRERGWKYRVVRSPGHG